MGLKIASLLLILFAVILILWGIAVVHTLPGKIATKRNHSQAKAIEVMRLVYHQKTHRVEGHIFITLLAYNLVHQIRCRLKEQGIHDSWDKIRATMSIQVRITTGLRGERGEQIHVRKSCRPSADQQILLRALGLEWLPGRTEKTVITP